MNSKEKIFLSNIDKINAMIEKNRPKTEIAKMLSMKQETLNVYLNKYNIKYKGNQYRFGMSKDSLKTPLEKILSNEVAYSASQLKKRLINDGIKENKCECCGITEWNGKEIKFELHHKDGNHYNNNLENLQLLCPNCHSQTDMFRSSTKKKNRISNGITNEVHKICPVCGKEIKGKRVNRKKYCSSECSNIARKKLPQDSIMCELILSGFSDKDIAKKYGASESLVKKWRKKNKI